MARDLESTMKTMEENKKQGPGLLQFARIFG